jgi:hypothetical protein
MTPTSPVHFALPPGQARMLRLCEGDQLFCAEGRLLVTEPPEALDEQAWRIRRTLRRGEGHAATRGGWLRVEAGDQPARLQVLYSGSPQRQGDALPACDPRVTVSPAVRGLWQIVERLATALANSARQRQQMPS